MKYAFIQRHQKQWPIRLQCKVLEVSQSGYYAHCAKRAGPKISKRMCDDRLLVHIKAIHREVKQEYGWPRMWRALKARHLCVGKERVRQLMKANHIQARCKRRFKITTDSNHALPVAPNLLNRQFNEIHQPDQVWTSDITYIATEEGWLYLAVIIDLFSRQVVGWSMKPHMKAELVNDALRMAWFKRHPAKGLILHTDRGSQYCSESFQDLLTAYGMRSSMSRKGNCWDNAPTESLWGSLKVARLHHMTFATRRAAMDEIIDWLNFYNANRLHSTLGYVSPMQFEKMWFADQGQQAA